MGFGLWKLLGASSVKRGCDVDATGRYFLGLRLMSKDAMKPEY
jgi:hypothetical protein